MSRVGRKPVKIPNDVKVVLQGQTVTVQGPKGKLNIEIHPRIKVAVQKDEILISRPTNVRMDRCLHGLVRSLIHNMVVGVTEGYKKDLEIEGVGYKAQIQGKSLNLSLGYTHPIMYDIPSDVEIKCPKPTQIHVSGLDKQRVGQVAADIRHFHEPEPYKGKGIHYVGEQIRRKQGKTVG